MRSFLFSLFFCCTAIFLHAQAVFTLSGKITNQKQEAIVGASIKVSTIAGGITKYFCISNAFGSYTVSFPNIHKTLYVEVSFIGRMSERFTLSPDTNKAAVNIRDIVLKTDSTILKDIIVKAALPVRVSGDTTFFTTRSFKQGNETNVSDLLNNMPGFSVEDGKIKYNGKQVSRVLVEDDDLFGKDYAMLAQNLATKGIETVELIKNYSDKTYLDNRLIKGNELVVNLKFSKKYLYKLLASNEMAASGRLNFYKIRQNIISLIPRLKFVTTTNFNNIGLLGSKILGKQETWMPAVLKQNNDAINFEIEPRSEVNPLAHIGDITSSILPQNQSTFNHTALFTNNLLWKPSNKLRIKSIIQYCQDKYNQYQSIQTNYSISGYNLQVSDSQALHKKLPVFGVSTELIYNPISSIQLIYKFNCNTKKDADSSSDNLQGVNTYSNFNSTNKNWQQEISIGLLKKNNKLFKVRGMEVLKYDNQVLDNFPATLWRPLITNPVYSHLGSFINTQHHEFGIETKFTAQEKFFTYSLYSSFAKGKTTLSTNAAIFDTISFLHQLTPENFNNNINWQYCIGNIGADIRKVLSARSYLTILQKVENGSIDFNDNNTNIHKNRTYFNYMPSIKFDYNISANKQINISWDVKNILPNISNVLPAYAIISNKEALQGVANINTGTTNTLSASYLYSDLIKTKLLFFVNASYSSGSILYLLNQEPSTFYIKSKNVSTSTNNKVVNLMSHISKYISNINSEIALEMAIVQNAGYCSINNIITPLEILNIIPAFKVKTILNRNIIIATGIKQTYATQFLNGVSVAKTTLLNENINCSYKISPHILFNIQYRNFVSKLSGASNSLLLCDASLKCTTAKGKLNFLVSANNIFNKSEFVFNSFTSISVATERMKILPRYFLLETTIEL